MPLPPYGHLNLSPGSGLRGSQAVLFVGLVSRTDLLGKRGVIKSYDATSHRYAVLVDATNESFRVLGTNMKAKSKWMWRHRLHTMA